MKTKFPLFQLVLLPGYTRKCSVTACSHIVAMAHERWSGCDTSKSDHKTVARKHKGSKCRKGIRTAAVVGTDALPAHPIYS